MHSSLAIVAAVLLASNSTKTVEQSNPTSLAQTASWEGKVMTVTGLIPGDAMGITLPHEHLLIVHTAEGNLTDEHAAAAELALFAKAGGKTLVEMTNYGIGRRPAALKQIAEQTGVQIIMGCGYYKDKWLSFPMRAKSEHEIAADMIHDIVEGVNGIHAGIIGELGVSRPITPFETRQLRAAAIAQKATGAAINIHFDVEDGLKARGHGMDVIEKAGGDLSRVVISHFYARPDSIDMCLALTKRGCYVEFDLFGLDKRGPWFRQDLTVAAQALKTLIDRGCIDHILLSQDLCFTSCYTKNGGYGYAHLLKNVVPKLKAAGITDQQIRTIMVENPERLFPFHNYSNTRSNLKCRS